MSPFLKEGKTNWKYILIVVILAVIVGGGILGYWQRWLPKEAPMPESKYRCFSCEEMPDESRSANLFLSWYNKVSGNSLKDAVCIRVCNKPVDIHEVTFNVNGKAVTVRGVGRIESEDKALESRWWFTPTNFCLTVKDCTGVRFEYNKEYSWLREEGPRGACVNKVWITYKPDEVFRSGGPFPSKDTLENWIIAETIERPMTQPGVKPIEWREKLCSCSYVNTCYAD